MVQDINPRIQYVANANQTVFSFNFLAFAQTDITVYYTPMGSTPSDVTQQLTYTVQFSVTLNPQPAVGGLVTLVTPCNAGDIVTIVRAQPDQRLNYYIDGGLFTATMVNTDFDQEILMIQQNTMYETAITPHYNLSASPDPVIDIYLPVLGPNQTWIKNASNTQIVAFNLSGTFIPVVQSTVSMTLAVNQSAHGFVVGNMLKCIGSNAYALAQADSAADAEVIGCVSAVTDANNFTLLFGGVLTGLTGLGAGSVVYLHPTVAGSYTNTRPTTAGQVVKPIAIGITSTVAIWNNMLGAIL